MIIAGLLAGTGVYEMAERVIQRCVDDPLVECVFVLTPTDRYRSKEFMSQSKIIHFNKWHDKDSHDKTGINREVLRSHIIGMDTCNWLWLGDEDALPAPDYFDKLNKIEYDYPVLLTGKTFNMDGSRFYDIASFQTDAQPFCVPYDDWENPRWSKDLYCSGNQHVMNRSGFNLGVEYPDVPGEDPHYCWAFKKAGGKLAFRPELSMTLLKQHYRANLGYAPCLPK